MAVEQTRPRDDQPEPVRCANLARLTPPRPRRTGCSCWDDYRMWCDDNDRDLYEMERWER